MDKIIYITSLQSETLTLLHTFSLLYVKPPCPYACANIYLKDIEYPQTSHVGAYRIRPEDIHVD